MTPHTYGLDTADMLARGEIKIIQFTRGYHCTLRNAEDMLAYEQAKLTGYVIMPRNEERYRSLEKVWSTWCEPRGWPIVAIVPRIKYAQVTADQIMIDGHQERIPRSVVDPLCPFLQEHCVKGWTSIDPTYIYTSRIPIPLAPFVASRIVDLLWAALSLPERTGQ